MPSYPVSGHVMWQRKIEAVVWSIVGDHSLGLVLPD